MVDCELSLILHYSWSPLLQCRLAARANLRVSFLGINAHVLLPRKVWKGMLRTLKRPPSKKTCVSEGLAESVNMGESTAKACTQFETELGVTRGTRGQVAVKSDIVLSEREMLSFGIPGDSSSSVIAQRTCIKYFARNGYTATKTLEILQKAFGDYILSKTRVFHWHKMFREGRERVEDEPRSGRPSTSTDKRHVAQVRDLVTKSRRITFRDIIDQVPISFGSCQSILRNHLGLRRTPPQVSPKTLKFLRQKQRYQATGEMLSRGES